MTQIATLGLAVGLMAAVTAVAEDKPGKLDPAKLVGEWTIVEGTKAGEKSGPDASKGAVTVTKDKMSLKNDDTEFEFGFKLDDKQTPVAVDLEILKPEGFKGATAKGIIKMDGEKVSLCYHPMMGERPTKFESTKDNGNYLFVMKKKDKKDK